ncbi:MAG TPA: patatin-like phospholipase family protein [Holophagaceae bacterium]|nr:patatin-like phospholipase family protein [Holophagaceae bacterium]
MAIPEGAPAVGLALSGGGIRSATFCLGVLKGLAQTRVLPRVDLLSTVSGGGYIGSFLGAWFTRAKGPEEVSDGLQGIGATESRPVRWLRENGYYLAPSGSADGALMGAIMLRNWVALQVVLAMLAIAAFLLLNGRLFLDAGICWPKADGQLWWSPWLWAPLVVFALVTLPQGWAYWMVTTPGTSKEQGNPLLGLGALLLAGVFGGWFYWHVTEYGALSGVLAAAGAESVLVLGWLFAAGGLRSNTKVPSAEQGVSIALGARARLSRGMAASLTLTLGLVFLGLVDSMGQSVYAVLTEQTAGGLHAWMLGISGGVVGAALIAQEIAHRLPKRKEDVSLPLSLIAAIAAFLLLGVALVGLNTFAHGLAWGFKAPRKSGGDVNVGRVLIRNATAQSPDISVSLKDQPKVVAQGVGTLAVEHPTVHLPSDRAMTVEWPVSVEAERRSGPDPVWYGWGLGITLGLSLMFSRILSFLNASSMGTFYQRRITRAYLGATNPDRETEVGGEVWRRQSVRESIPGDDIPWSQYLPFMKGGPLHFIFTTINETVDGKSQVQQRDRKGTGLGVGPAGLSVGVRHHAEWEDVGHKLKGIPVPGGGWSVFPDRTHLPEPLTAGQWVGISGAAFSTGMGFRTSAGLSMLCGMFNVRTGYWWRSGVDRWLDKGVQRPPSAVGLFSRFFPVQAHLLDELRARFPGTSKRHWYLSDGGHFENSAIYELARRRVPVILACDAGEDAGYLFDDLANLTLKLRADFGAELSPVAGDDLRVAGEELQRALGLEHPPSISSLDHLRRGEWKEEGEMREWKLKKAGTEGHSLGHAYAARIAYPGGAGSLVLFFKPALTGDESRDVAYYHAEHPAFPHEPTLDQFFDEAQWEAYRKLGEHSALSVLAPLAVAP